MHIPRSSLFQHSWTVIGSTVSPSLLISNRESELNNWMRLASELCLFKEQILRKSAEDIQLSLYELLHDSDMNSNSWSLKF